MGNTVALCELYFTGPSCSLRSRKLCTWLGARLLFVDVTKYAAKSTRKQPVFLLYPFFEQLGPGPRDLCYSTIARVGVAWNVILWARRGMTFQTKIRGIVCFFIIDCFVLQSQTLSGEIQNLSVLCSCYKDVREGRGEECVNSPLRLFLYPSYPTVMGKLSSSTHHFESAEPFSCLPNNKKPPRHH